MIKLLGPLTHTLNGETTLYGVASSVAAEIIRGEDGIYRELLYDESMYTRVAHPDIRKWVDEFKEEYK